MPVNRNSEPLNAFDKAGLINSDGETYADFRGRIRPRYARNWAAITLAYLALAGAIVLLSRLSGAEVAVQLAATIPAALLIGYCIAFIGLFVHEAAHYNMAADRARNDFLTNLLVGPLIAMDVRRYRPVHMQHHKRLGHSDDTERSYFSSLDLRFIIETLTGIRVLKVLLSYQQYLDTAPDETAGQGFFSWTLIGTLLVHGGVLLIALVLGYWAVALAWLAGAVLVFPFFASLRQVLEHRSVEARGESHLAANRLFGDGPVASTLGGAGFNRHLLHHWDPGISCTRLRDVERFLLDSPAADTLRRHQTTYWRTFKQLYAG